MLSTTYCRVLLCVTFDCSVIYYVPPRYFFLVDSETGADVRVFDYTKDDPSLLEQPGKPPPPLITRYRLFISILLTLE